MQCIRGDGGKMAALLCYLFFLFTVVSAQDDEDTFTEEETYTPGETWGSVEPVNDTKIPTEYFYVSWMDTGDYEGDVTIELHEINPTGDRYNVFSTTVPATKEYTYLPERALPSLEAGDTTTLDLWVYTMSDDGWAWGSIVTGISLYDTRPATVTVTPTLSPTTTHATSTTPHWSEVTPMATASPTNETVEISSDNGLSTGAKAGIGVGAAVGAFLLLAAAFFFFRRWQKSRQIPKTIREISAGENPSSSVAFINGLPSDNGSGNGSGAHLEVFGHGSVISAPSENGVKEFRGVSLPVVVSPIEEDRSVAGGRRSGERFELGG